MHTRSTEIETAHFPFFLGVDVGGTNIKLGIVDDHGNTIHFDSVPTDSVSSPEIAIADIKKCYTTMVEQLNLQDSDVAAVGLGTPGTMDIPNGQLLTPHNLPGWWNYPIKQRLSEALEKPVTFVNDANAAAFGEYWVGTGSQYESIVLLTLGTGVGGGIIVDGQLIHGTTSHGGEIGHILIDSAPNARVCGCGKSGHLEAYASASALIQITQEQTKNHSSSLLSQWQDEGQTLTGKLIADAANQGDAFALQMIDELATHLGRGIATVSFMVDPSAVILGGAMNFGGQESELGQQFLNRVLTTVKELTFPEIGSMITICFASLGGAAGYIGAAGVARQAFHSSNAPSSAASPS